ncbi:MAG: peptidase [Acidobacteriota bacterium]
MKTTIVALLMFLPVILSCQESTSTNEMEKPAVTTAAATATELSFATDVADRMGQLPKTTIDYDHGLLDANQTAVVAKLIEASKQIDEIFWRQVSESNPVWRAQLQKQASSSPQAQAALNYFLNMKGPWDSLKKEEPFVLVGPKPPGAAFYPPDMTKEQFESWLPAHPNDKAAFQGLFTVIRRQNGNLVAIPYSQYYRDQLIPAAAKLREAAALAKNASLKAYLNKRADAFLSDDYFASDLAWMDLNSDIEVVIGPYEVYEDNLFNYKASYESFVTVVDKPESAKLAVYAKHLPDMEKNLPIPDEHKNPNRGSDSPIRVVQEIYTAGDARHGVQTSAFNLPNDERVREAKGSKKVLLKNVMDAKYEQSGKPIAERVLDPSQVSLLSFDAYFNHVLFHELSHGLGPGIIKGPKGEKVEARLLLKDLYSTIEECKADVLGIWNIRYAMDHSLLSSFSKEQLYATDAGLMFRSMRFGLDEAHGRGTALQWNWYREKGGIVPASDGRFRIDAVKMAEANRSLANELLMIEALGDYNRARTLLDKYGVTNPEIQATIARLADIPVDIDPVYPAAGETK